MVFYFAPLEGFTDAIYRRVHRRTFPGIAKYFMPFISPSASLSFTSRQQWDISPQANAGVPAVPQILARDAARFLDMAVLLRDAGYGEVNLNLGCPSGTVTAKGKGAGMLRDLNALSAFLDAVYARSPLPVSLKTRIGFDSPDEWPPLLDLLVRYPVKEWILHPRTKKEFYSGSPHRECFAQAAARAPFPVIYNGNLFTAEGCRRFARAHPACQGAMLGRGLLTNPALAREASGGAPLAREELSLFHDRLYAEYLKHWPEHAVVGRMHGIMGYMAQALTVPAPLARALRKASSPQAYADAAAAVFSRCPLKSPPEFIPPD